MLHSVGYVDRVQAPPRPAWPSTAYPSMLILLLLPLLRVPTLQVVPVGVRAGAVWLLDCLPRPHCPAAVRHTW